MGMIKCPIHGIEFIALSCVHIGRAFEENRYEHVNVLIDTYGAPIHLCDTCFPKALQHTATAREWITGDLEVVVEMWVPCSECFDKWYTGTGQEDLLETIEQIKADYLSSNQTGI